LIIAYNIVFSERDNRLLVKGISIGTDKITYLKYSFDKKHFLFSDLDKENFMGKYRISVGKKIKFSTIFELIPISEDQPPFHCAFRLRLRRSKDLFSDTIYSLIQLIVSKLRTAFDSELINYVNPLRAFPRRYYFLDRSNISHSLNTIDGDNLTEILKEDKLVRDKVNKWLEKFDLKVTVNAIQDVIHQINVHQHGINLDLTDVGFGLSQILPVIVQGFLSKKNSLTIIEQPEIHLHPKMQAELADLFIDIIYNSEHRPDRYLLVETHSEYILKRIRRRIAEKKLNYEDVSIYFIQPRTSKSDYAEIQEIEIDKGGAFKWPREFYEEDLEDTIQFLKHQTVEN